MAKKAFVPLEYPPTASSSEEEEISSEEEDNDEQISPKDPVTVDATAKQLDFDSDSDSENEPKEPEVPPNRRSGKAIAVTPLKRRREGTSRNVTAKKAKTGTKTWARLSWCGDDETTLLQRMIDFHADTGTNPYDDRNSFFEFVKKEISFEATKRQAIEKIRSLKRKYIGEGEKRVKASSFSKSHDKECMRLAKRIWGSDGMLLLTSVKSKNGRSKGNEEKKKVESVEPVEEEDEEILAHGGGDSGKMVVEEDNEVLAHGGVDSGENVVEEEDNEVFTHSGVDKAVEEKDKEVFRHGGGDKAVEEGDKEVFTNGDGDLGKKAVEEGEKEVLTNGAGNLGKKAVEEGDKEVLANGGGNLGKKAVEEGDKEVLTNGGGQSESLCVKELDWFEKSVLVKSMAGFGVEEHSVKERWSLFPAETKKKLEHGWNSLVSKEFEIVSLKSKYMSELASMLGEAK